MRYFASDRSEQENENEVAPRSNAVPVYTVTYGYGKAELLRRLRY